MVFYVTRNEEITQHVLASATLVDFPQFSDVHHLIPQLLDLRLKYPERPQIEDPGKWEIYVKYRRIVAQFLTDQTRSGSSFVGQIRYAGLAKYLALFLSDDLE